MTETQLIHTDLTRELRRVCLGAGAVLSTFQEDNKTVCRCENGTFVRSLVETETGLAPYWSRLMVPFCDD